MFRFVFGSQVCAFLLEATFSNFINFIAFSSYFSIPYSLLSISLSILQISSLPLARLVLLAPRSIFGALLFLFPLFIQPFPLLHLPNFQISLYLFILLQPAQLASFDFFLP